MFGNITDALEQIYTQTADNDAQACAERDEITEHAKMAARMAIECDAKLYAIARYFGIPKSYLAEMRGEYLAYIRQGATAKGGIPTA